MVNNSLILLMLASLMGGWLPVHFLQKASHSITSDLGSDHWQVRRDAFERLLANPAVLQSREGDRQLIQLREREDSAEESGPEDLFEIDAYVAYDTELSEAVKKIAARTESPDAWKSLVYARYNPDSAFGLWLGAQQGALPYLYAQAHDRSPVRRMTAVYLLGVQLESNRRRVAGVLPPAKVAKIHSVIRRLAHEDHEPAVAQWAARALGLIGDASDQRMLEEMALRPEDPYTRQEQKNAAAQIGRRLSGTGASP